jgi:hypothetical protein
MTPRSVPASKPAQDLSGVPDEWLEAQVIYLSDDDGSDGHFAETIGAIYRIHEIEEGRGRLAYPSLQEAQIELDRRRGVKPRPPELMSRLDAINALRRCLECRQWAARMYLDMIPALNDSGEPPWYGQRRWHRLADVQALLNGEGS